MKNINPIFYSSYLVRFARSNTSIFSSDFGNYAVQTGERRIIDDDYPDRPAYVLMFIHVYEVLRVVMLAFTRLIGEPNVLFGHIAHIFRICVNSFVQLQDTARHEGSTTEAQMDVRGRNGGFQAMALCALGKNLRKAFEHFLN